uniref:Uncharacterized protein n=1 Tax=Arundo donax TaxID=35708 RepID=A0A0A9GGN9_ARUDO
MDHPPAGRHNLFPAPWAPACNENMSAPLSDSSSQHVALSLT